MLIPHLTDSFRITALMHNNLVVKLSLSHAPNCVVRRATDHQAISVLQTGNAALVPI